MLDFWIYLAVMLVNVFIGFEIGRLCELRRTDKHFREIINLLEEKE